MELVDLSLSHNARHLGTKLERLLKQWYRFVHSSLLRQILRLSEYPIRLTVRGAVTNGRRPTQHDIRANYVFHVRRNWRDAFMNHRLVKYE